MCNKFCRRSRNICKKVAEMLLLRFAFWGAFVLVLTSISAAAIGIADQKSVVRLTQDGGSYCPKVAGWSPDGTKILFTKRYEKNSQGIRLRQLHIMNADGSDVKAISKRGDIAHHGWSPDSGKVAYIYSEGMEPTSQAGLYLYDVATGQSKQLLSDLKRNQVRGMVGWSTLEWTNDSKSFVLLLNRSSDDSVRADAYLINVETGRSTGLTPNNYTTGDAYPLNWSPDNSQFALRSASSRRANNQIWVANRDGSNLRPITPPDWQIMSDAFWNPKGDWLAFCTTHDRLVDEQKAGMADLWLMRPDGKECHPLTHGSSPSRTERLALALPQWTADGRYVVCVARRYDEKLRSYLGFCLVDVQTNEIINVVQNSPESDQYIDGWYEGMSRSPDGKKIAFPLSKYTIRGQKTESPTCEDPRDYICVYDIPSRTLHELASSRPIEDGISFAGSSYDWQPHWSPDSRKLLFIKAKVISYENWEFEPDIYVRDFSTSKADALPETEPAKVVEKAADAAATAETSPTVVLVSPKNRRASEIAESLPESYKSIYRIDTGLNALVVSAQDEAALKALTRDVELLDRPTPQIMVDVMVTDLTDDASRQLGLDWQGSKSRWGFKLPLGDGLDAGHVIYQGVGILKKEFFATLSALEEKGKATVRANPRVLATCGTEATINIRRTDNFLYESGTDNQGRAMRSRSDISADTILKFTPQLLASNKIAMKLDATVDSFVFGSSNDLPDTTRRQTITDVVVGDGETIIIGGLTLEEQTTKVKKTPILGDIPIIGGFFRNSNRSSRKSDLVILVSPHVVLQANTGTASGTSASGGTTKGTE